MSATVKSGTHRKGKTLFELDTSMTKRGFPNISKASSSKSSLNETESGKTLHVHPTQDWAILPRPKVGRRPLAADLSSKNSVNRESQRAFRKRKTDYVQSLEKRLKDYEKGQIERIAAVQKAARIVQEENTILQLRLEEMEKSLQEYKALLRERAGLKFSLNECRRAKQVLEQRISILTNELSKNGSRSHLVAEKDVQTSSSVWHTSTSASYPELAYFAARPTRPSLPIANLLNESNSKLCDLCTHESGCLCKEIIDEVRVANGDGIPSSTRLTMMLEGSEPVTYTEPDGLLFSPATRLGILSRETGSCGLNEGIQLPQHDTSDSTPIKHATEFTKTCATAVSPKFSTLRHPASYSIHRSLPFTCASNPCTTCSSDRRAPGETIVLKMGPTNYKLSDNLLKVAPTPSTLVSEALLPDATTGPGALLCCGDRLLCSGMGFICAEQMEQDPYEQIHLQSVIEKQMRDGQMEDGRERHRQERWAPLRALIEVSTDRINQEQII